MCRPNEHTRAALRALPSENVRLRRFSLLRARRRKRPFKGSVAISRFVRFVRGFAIEFDPCVRFQTTGGFSRADSKA